jgi:hypothetical protein
MIGLDFTELLGAIAVQPRAVALFAFVQLELDPENETGG